MITKRFVLILAFLALVVSPLVFSPVAMAQTGASEVAEFCREADEGGLLDALGVTRGECVNLFKASPSVQSNSFIAAICGSPFAQELTGTSNKGQCIKVLKASGGV